MISTASHEDGNGSRKEMLTEDFQGNFQGASVRESSPKKSQPGYGAYNAKAQNCVPNVFRREMERQMMQPGDVKMEG